MSQLTFDRRSVVLGMAGALSGLSSPVRAQISNPSRRLRFFVVGDWGRDGRYFQTWVARWMEHHRDRGGCDFIVSTGDNFYTLGVSSVDDGKWKSSFEDIYSPELRGNPWFAIAGNHDWGGNVFAQVDRTGRGGWHMPWLFYHVGGSCFGREDVDLFFIDTVAWEGKEGKGYNICGQALRQIDIEEQEKWLRDALQSSRAPIKLVFGHYPVYSVGKHGTGRRELPSLDRLLIENGVSAYICGHDHCLYHIQTPSMTYVCSGGGSEELLYFTGDRQVNGRIVRDGGFELHKSPTWYQFLANAGFAIFEIGADDMSFQFVDRNGLIGPKMPIPVRGLAKPLNAGVAPPDAAVLETRARARAKSYFPCTQLIEPIIDLVS